MAENRKPKNRQAFAAGCPPHAAASAVAARLARSAQPSCSAALAHLSSARTACAACHHDAYDNWLQSDHRHAMEVADDRSPCSAISTMPPSTTSAPSRASSRGMASTSWRPTTPQASPRTFAVAYTFGHYPLQQYLIAFPDGRMQALSVSWDSRPAAQGGQRWFHLYPDQKIAHEDPLHWTGAFQNWNSALAPAATPPTWSRTTRRIRIATPRTGRSSTWAAKPAMGPARGMWPGPTASAHCQDKGLSTQIAQGVGTARWPAADSATWPTRHERPVAGVLRLPLAPRRTAATRSHARPSSTTTR